MFDKVKNFAVEHQLKDVAIRAAVTMGTIIVVNIVAGVLTSVIMNAINGESSNVIEE